MLRLDLAKPRTKKYIRADGLIWVIIGIAMCIGSIKLQLGSLRAPGPGFLPFFSGALLGIFGLILMVSTALAGEKEREQPENSESRMKWNWRRSLTPLLTLGTLFAYILLLEPLGFMLTTFVCLLLLFKLSEPRRWLMPLVLSGVTAVLSYLLFSVWLQAHFPKGLLTFW
jgi:putative tricarboxylic transport membrane protein